MPRNTQRLIVVIAVLGVAVSLAFARRDPGPDPAEQPGTAVPSRLRLTSDLPPPPVEDSTVAYTVAPGDTLGAIAGRLGTPVETLMRMNGLSDPDALLAGQELVASAAPTGESPDVRLVPDSELMFGPAHNDVEPTALVPTGGRLAGHSEPVDGIPMSGPEIVDRVVRDFSVGPRVLLAFVEASSGWVTGPGQPAMADYPAGLQDPGRRGLWWQLTWLANALNEGYYDWTTRGARVMRTADGAHLAGHTGLNPGSYAIQYALAAIGPEASLPDRVAAFDAAYRRLYGDPWLREQPVPAPDSAPFPELRLPFDGTEGWWMTGGPHGGWLTGSAKAALDFVPPGDERGCFVASTPVLAVADGTVLDFGDGGLLLDLDGDGRRTTGPVVFYLHVAPDGRAVAGSSVQAGEPLGYPSCHGGSSSATHLHIARLLDGQWLPADSDPPFILGEWRTVGSTSAYDGGMVHASGAAREACECRVEGVNDVGDAPALD